MGWCDFPVDCGNSIEVRESTGPKATRFRASWLVLSRIRPRYQVDTYLRVQSTVSSQVENQRAGS